MKYWFDTEFIEDGKTIDLISIGIVAEDGREFYAENADCDLGRASDWVRENVIDHLVGGTARVRRSNLRDHVLDFIGTESPQIWAYYADYDWVALCQLFGTMIDLPIGWPMYCRDVKQLCDECGNPKLPDQTSTEHHALADARWTKEAWAFLKSVEAAELTSLRSQNKGMREALTTAAIRFDLLASDIADSHAVTGTLRAERTIRAKNFALEAQAALSPTSKEETENVG